MSLSSASKGSIAATQNQSLAVGYNAAPLSVSSINAFMGYQVALYSRTGSYNVGVGSESALRMGSSYNCAVGYAAAPALADGGAATVVGALASATLVLGRANTLLGCAAEVSTAGVEDAVAEGAAARSGGASGVAIGAGTAAGAARSLAIWPGARATGEGHINILDHVRGGYDNRGNDNGGYNNGGSGAT